MSDSTFTWVKNLDNLTTSDYTDKKKLPEEILFSLIGDKL